MNGGEASRVIERVTFNLYIVGERSCIYPIIIDGTFDWTTYKVTLANIEPDVYQLYVFLVYTPATTGEVFFDDAVLTVVE